MAVVVHNAFISSRDERADLSISWWYLRWCSVLDAPQFILGTFGEDELTVVAFVQDHRDFSDYYELHNHE
jgi:hypothetical protein